MFEIKLQDVVFSEEIAIVPNKKGIDSYTYTLELTSEQADILHDSKDIEVNTRKEAKTEYDIIVDVLFGEHQKKIKKLIGSYQFRKTLLAVMGYVIGKLEADSQIKGYKEAKKSLGQARKQMKTKRK